MNRSNRLALLAIILIGVSGGCTSAPLQPKGPSPVANTVRAEIGRIAIRGPTHPAVSLTTIVDDKGVAAGKTARRAGLGWLGGSLRAAGETGDPFAGTLVAAVGLIAAPVVAAGGAVYGAAAADSQEELESGNAILEQELQFAPERFRIVLEKSFTGRIPVEHAFVTADTTDQSLRSRGFDSVMDVRMAAIKSHPSANQFSVLFELLNTVTLTSLADGRVLEHRRYFGESSDRNVSDWVEEDARELHEALSAVLTDTAEEIADAFFLAPAIRVQGLEPVSRQRFGTGKISGTRPVFVWSAVDGGRSAPAANVEYEILIHTSKETPADAVQTRSTRYVPPEPLRPCERYEWKVRASYLSFGKPVTSDWSPTYRFRTPCG